MHHILVTGAGGFIGSHLVEDLVGRGYSVRAFVRYNGRSDWGNLERLDKSVLDAIEVIAGDITDPFFVDRAVSGVDTVFHLAALIAIPYSYQAPEHFVRVNVDGTLNILQASLRNHVQRVVHTSTSETYGTAQYVPIDEKHPFKAQSPYAATKIAADSVVESFHLSFGLPVTIVRPFNTFGPRQSARAIIPTIISQVLSGVSSLQLGSLHPVRDFNYVKDVVNGFVLAATCNDALGKVFNLGSGVGISIRQTVELILKLSGKDGSVSIDLQPERIRPENSEVLQLVCDSTQARLVLGWAPRIAFEEGLKQTIEYVSRHPHLYKPAIYSR